MVLATQYEYRAAGQEMEDLSPVLNSYGYEGRAYTMVVNDGGAAKSDRPEWMDRDIGAPVLNAQVEGATYSNLATAVSAGTRRINFTQILMKVINVTETAEAVDIVGGSAVKDQTKLRMMQYLNDLEYNCLNATGVTGQTATARAMFGVFAWALTNGDTGSATRSWNTTSSGVSADTSNIRTLQLHGNKKGVNISDFIVDDTIKTRISNTSTAAQPVYRVQDDQTIFQSVDMYKTDYSGSRLWLSHYVEFEGGPTGSTRLFGGGTNHHLILGLDRSQVERAWLRKTRMHDVPNVADSLTYAIKGELTQRYWAPAAIQVFWGVL